MPTQMIDGIEVLIEGSGPAMLVLHGTPGDWRQTEPVARRWRSEMTVIRPSRPGYGRTSLELGRTLHEQAVLMDGLLETLGIDAAVIVGVSGGGPSALAQAQDFPDRCRGLILCCAIASNMPMTAYATGMAFRRGRLDPILSPVVRAFMQLRVRRDERQIIAELTDLERAELAADPVVAADVHDYARHTAAEMSLAGIRNDVRQFLEREELTAQVPTLIVHGDADATVPLACAELHHATIPGSELEILADRTHALPITAAADFDAAVHRWMLASSLL